LFAAGSFGVGFFAAGFAAADSVGVGFVPAGFFGADFVAAGCFGAGLAAADLGRADFVPAGFFWAAFVAAVCFGAGLAGATGEAGLAAAVAPFRPAVDLAAACDVDVAPVESLDPRTLELGFDVSVRPGPWSWGRGCSPRRSPSISCAIRAAWAARVAAVAVPRSG